MSGKNFLAVVAAVGLALGLSGCSGFRANPEDCSAIGSYVQEIVALQNATNQKFSDNSYRRSGIKLWTAKLDSLAGEVSPREPELKAALSDWISTSRAVAETLKPNILEMNTGAVNEAADAFQVANKTLGSMCSF